MKVANFKYFINEGCRSFFVNWTMTFSCVIIVTACLTVFGTYMVFGLNMNHAARVSRAETSIPFFVNRETSEARTRALAAEILAIPNVADVEFRSREEGLRAIATDIPLELLEDNPLYDSYIVSFIDLEFAEATTEEIMRIREITGYRSSDEAIQMIRDLTRNMQILALILMIMMVAISVFIIANTIKITVFARRRDINIMKFVGATDWFIRWPFIIEGIVIGIVGALVSFVVMWFGYGWVTDMFVQAFRHMDMFAFILPLQVLGPIMFVSFMVFGILIGGTGSIISVRRHLNV